MEDIRVLSNDKLFLDNIINEDLIQEIFRQRLIEEGIASDYVLLHEDNFGFRQEDHGVSGTISIFKDSSNIWVTWEIDGDNEYTNIAMFRNQIDAYMDAAKRRGLDLSYEDFKYDIEDMLRIVAEAKEFLLAGIESYVEKEKLQERYLLLDAFEKQLLSNNNLKKLVRKRGNGND